MKTFTNRTAVITGGGSGFGLEFARLGASHGMNLVLADVQQDALDGAVAELQAKGAKVLAMRCDVANGEQVQALADATVAKLGVPHLVFNNAGVGSGGLIWENTLKDWEWVIGVNLWGVIHGLRIFTPLMLRAAQSDPNYEGHMVNTASMAGLLNAPNMGVYNVSKHAVVSLSESQYQDLALVSTQVSCSVLCPFFVPTGISQSHRNRPGEMRNNEKPTRSQLIAQAMSEKAVGGGKVSAADVAKMVFEGIAARQFYLYSHPKALATVQTRLEDIMLARNPTDPFKDKPEIGAQLRAALKA
jgi:NAD(P)-dependent dehydrogenase (short-subunit alcohol dehydrogenase family)